VALGRAGRAEHDRRSPCVAEVATGVVAAGAVLCDEERCVCVCERERGRGERKERAWAIPPLCSSGCQVNQQM
jgi:hypothetical protein